MVRSIYTKYLLIFIGLALISCGTTLRKTYVFAGSFTQGIPSNGIVVFDMNRQNGSLTKVSEVDSVINPSFLKISPNGKYLYACTESQMDTHGKIASFQVDSLTGKLKLLDKKDSGGRNPAHLSINKDNNLLVASNYTDASLTVFRLNENGTLDNYEQILKFTDSSVVKGRQDEAHIHSSNFSPDGKFLFAQDLGADKIRVFGVDEKSNQPLTMAKSGAVKTKLGAGPRHFTFHPNGKYGYGIEELSGKISFYRYKEGALTFEANYLSYAEEQEVYRTADIHISPDGKFLYGSNRGPDEDSISVFYIDESDGTLTLVGHEPIYGEHPRNFAIDPSGKFLIVANQFSNNIVVFKRDRKTGMLQKLSQQITMDNPSTLQIRSYKN